MLNSTSMPTGPYKYDPVEKRFVARDGAGPQDEQVPVDPMAGPLAAVGKIQKEPASWHKRIFWSILATMFGVWILLIVIWTGGARSRGHTGLTNEPAAGRVALDFEQKLN